MVIEINFSETSGSYADTILSGESRLPCFFPICIYSFMENRPVLKEMIPWLAGKSSHLKVVIGDYLERHNSKFFDSIPEDEAIEKLSKRGKKIEHVIETILAESALGSSVSVESCQSIIECTEGQEIARTLRAYCGKNPFFQADIEKQINLMLKGKLGRQLIQPDAINSETVRHLQEYMIEELVLYILLYQKEYKTEFYPGRDLNILRSIVTGFYKNFPYDLSQRTHLSVSVRLANGASFGRVDQSNKSGE